MPEWHTSKSLLSHEITLFARGILSAEAPVMNNVRSMVAFLFLAAHFVLGCSSSSSDASGDPADQKSGSDHDDAGALDPRCPQTFSQDLCAQPRTDVGLKCYYVNDALVPSGQSPVENAYFCQPPGSTDITNTDAGDADGGVLWVCGE